MTPYRRPASGDQVTITAGDYRATVTSVGAALRELTYRGRDLIVPFGADEIRPCYHGSVLVPWPNRIGGGSYELAGVRHQLPINEPERGNALHGLATFVDWQVLPPGPASVELTCSVAAQPGYPFTIDVTVLYRLTPEGLHWEVSATNVGDDPAPFGVATHPYLRGAEGGVDDWTMTVPADRIVESSSDTLLPVALRDVSTFANGHFDYRISRSLRGARIDHAFQVGAAGRSCVEVVDAQGHGAALEWDSAALPWLQVFTSDLPGTAIDRTGVAVEAMSCPPDFLNWEESPFMLAPGKTHETSVSIKMR